MKQRSIERHKTFDILPELIGAIQIPDGLSARNWLGCMALVQLMIDGIEHSFDPTYTLCSSDIMHKHFGFPSNGGLGLKSPEFSELFEILPADQHQRYGTGIRLKADNLAALQAVKQLNDFSKRLRLTAEQIYDVSINGQSRAFITLVDIQKFLSSRISGDLAPTMAAIKKWSRTHMSKVSSGYPNTPTNPSLIPNRTTQKLANYGFEVAITAVQPIMHIAGEPLFTSNADRWRPSRNEHSFPSDPAKYENQAIEIPIHFDLDAIRAASPMLSTALRHERFDHCMRLIEDHDSKLVYTYWRHRMGRLYILGGEPFNLQTLPREVRKALLCKHHNYDFSTSHPRLLASVARQCGHRLVHTEFLISNKRAVRRHVRNIMQQASASKVDIDEAKALLTAQIYGQGIGRMGTIQNAVVNFDHASEYAQTDILSRDADADTQSFLRALHEELDLASVIMDKWWKSNALAQTIHMPEHYWQRRNRKSRMAFMLQQLEARAIELIATVAASKGVEFIIHDGFSTSRELHQNEIDEACNRFKQQFGFSDSSEPILIELDD